MYPLKFQPIFQKRIWGGNRLGKILGKPLPAEWAGAAVGESWELADLPAGTVKRDSVGANADGSLSSMITNGLWKGKSLHDVLPGSGIMGNAALGTGGRFPLLIKFLDSQTDLSVQVHPDAAYAAAHADAHLKSEAWYILHAQPGAKIYKGVKAGVTKEAFRAALQNEEIEPLLNVVRVRAGDCHYLQSGTVHALGAGILAAEVQTPSDTTFRVFDWNRIGPDGKGRALHVEQALEVINFSPLGGDAGPRSQTTDASVMVSRLVTCDYFSIDRVGMAAGVEKQIGEGRPVVWIVLEGQGVIHCDGLDQPTAFARGDTLLLPANMTDGWVKTVASATWLEARMPGGLA